MKQNFTLKTNLVDGDDFLSAREIKNPRARTCAFKSLFKKIFFTFLFSSCLFLTKSFAQLAAWDFTGEASQATSAAEIYNVNLDASNLITRGTGSTPSAGANSFRTLGFGNNGISLANTDYFQITLSSSPGYSMSLSTIDAQFAGTLAFYAIPGVSSQFAYSLDGTTFILIGTPIQSTALVLPQINLSGITALQNIPATTVVTIRYYASGQTTTGGWGFTSPSTSSYGLAIGGTSSFVGKTSTANGAWLDPNIWTPLGVPTPSDNVMIQHDIDAGALTRNPGTATIINNAGKLTISREFTSTGSNTNIFGIFQLNAGGYTTGGAFNYGPTGTLNFNNSSPYGVNNLDAYWPTVNRPFNVNVLQGGLNLINTSRTVSGTFTTAAPVSGSGSSVLTLAGINQINSGGSFGFSPIYTGAASTLIYNTGAGFGNGPEWTGGGSTAPSVGSGTPGNVIIQTNGTNVSLAGARGTPGNITVNNSAVLTLNGTSGDLFIGGNLTLNGGSGGLINNNRAVQFVQNTGTQTITAAGGNIFFDYLLINKPGGTVQLNATDVTINTTIGNVLQLIDNSSLDLNGRALNLNNDNGGILSNGVRFITSTMAGASMNINGNKGINYALATNSLTFESNVTVRINPNNDFSFGSGNGIVNGTLEINNGAFISAGGTPFYGVGSLLRYNANSNYNRSLEWTSIVPTAKGCPFNVTLSNNTQFNLGANAGTNTPWLIGGNLVVDGGAGFYLDFGTDDMNQPLTVAGNLTVTGNLSLSNNSLGDIKVGGNILFNSGYNFNANQRAVFFTKNGTQTISAASTPNFHYLVFQPVTGTTRVELNGTDLNITAPATGNIISFSGSNTDVLALNGRALTLGTATFQNAISGTGFFEGSISSSLTLLGTGDIGAIRFSGATPILNNFTINRTASATAATLGTSLQINNSFTLSNGILQLGDNNLTLASAVTSSGTASAFVVTNGTGSLRKYWSTPGSFTFHIGESTGTTEYSPATLQFVGGVFGLNNYTGVRVIDAAQPNIPVSADNYITRYWAVSAAAINGTTLDYNFTGTYLPIDVVGSITDALSGRWDGSNWTDGAALAANTVSVIGLTTLPLTNEFTGAKITGKNHFFRSIITGNWNNKASWESSKDGSTNWVAATNYPGTAAGGINIRNTHTITQTEEEKARLLTVETGGTLTNTNVGGGFVLSIADDGTAANDFIINGTYELFGTGPAFATGATAIVNTNGLARANGNLNGESDEFAQLSNVSFQTNAVFEWNTTEVFEFGGVTYFPTATPTTLPIFRLRQTPSTSPGVGGVATINGVFQVNSNITLIGGSAKIFRNGITGNAILTQNTTSGNTFNITGPTGILGGANLRIVLNTTLNLTGTIIVPVDSTVTISGNNINNNLTGNILQVNGTLDVTTVAITNTTGSVVVNGLFRTARSGGFSDGTITNASIPSGTVTLGTSSTVELYSTLIDQGLNSRSDFANLIFSGTGTKTISGPFIPVGTVTIKDAAILDIANRTFGSDLTNLTMTGGRFRLAGTGTKPDINGVYNLSDGVIEFYNDTTVNNQTIKGISTFSNPIVYKTIEVTGRKVAQGAANITLGDLGIFRIKNAGIFESNDDAIVGPGFNNQSLIIENGGIFRTGDIHGFSGGTGTTTTSVRLDIENVVLQDGSTVEYSRTLSDGNQIITNAQVYKNLSIAGTGTKTAPSTTLTIQGNLTKSGTSTFNPNNGLVLLNGTTQSFAGVDFYGLEMTGGTKTTAGLSTVSDVLIINTNAVLNVSNTDTLSLKSVTGKTARLAELFHSNPATAITYNGTGNIRVERHIKAGRKWRYLSVPTDNNLQTFKTSWQEGAILITDNFRPGYGIIIGDSSSTAIANGFDLRTFDATVKTYNPVTGIWNGISSTNITPERTKAYLAFISGDRTRTTSSTGTSETTIRSTGKLNVGNIDVNIPADQFVGIGNPYASPLQMDSLIQPDSINNGIAKAYYVWDPQASNGPNNVGRFQVLVWDVPSNGFLVTPGGGSYPNLLITYDSIESGQAFLVRGTSSGGRLHFKESAKTISAPSINFTSGVAQRLNVSLLNGASNGSNPSIIDGFRLMIDNQFGLGLDENDIFKISNNFENIGILQQDSILMVERRSLNTSSDTIHISTRGLRVQNYQWQIAASNMDYPGRTGFFVDRFTNTSTALQMVGATSINFAVQNTPASYATNRFYIVFRQESAGPLPVTFTTVTATRNADKTIGVQWKVEQEINITQYEVERSSNGTLFTNLFSRSAAVNNGAGATYDHIDAAPYAFDNFYRIKATSIDGQVQYSEIVKVGAIKTQPMITAYPNPVVDQLLQLQFQQQTKGRYRLQLRNASGQVVWNSILQQQQSNQNHQLRLPSKLAAGQYQLMIKGEDGNKTNLAVYLQ